MDLSVALLHYAQCQQSLFAPRSTFSYYFLPLFHASPPKGTFVLLGLAQSAAPAIMQQKVSKRRHFALQSAGNSNWVAPELSWLSNWLHLKNIHFHSIFFGSMWCLSRAESYRSLIRFKKV